ncbi:MAG: hypothetical protein ACMUHM_08420, partial [Thermoplasmatota archaeon]
MKIGLVSHLRKAAALKVAREFLDIVEGLERDGKGISLVIDEDLKNELNEDRFSSAAVEKMDPRMIICIGGDG